MFLLLLTININQLNIFECIDSYNHFIPKWFWYSDWLEVGVPSKNLFFWGGESFSTEISTYSKKAEEKKKKKKKNVI